MQEVDAMLMENRERGAGHSQPTPASRERAGDT